MATRQPGVVSVSAEDIMRDRAAEDAALETLQNKIVSRVSSPPRRGVVNVQPYEAPTLNPNSTRT